MPNNLVLAQTPALDTNNPSNRCEKAGRAAGRVESE
jgi:hypothetical protein